MSDKELSQKAREALKFIRNNVMHFGKVPSVRKLMDALDYKSPRSAMLLLEELESGGFLKKKTDGTLQFIKDLREGIVARTITLPLIGSVSCGAPMLAEENVEAMIPVSVSMVKPGSKYFLLRANGDSMNKVGINDGDLLLVKQQSSADPGQKVVALIDDSATVKEYHPQGDFVMLKPKSTNPTHQPIILTDDFHIQGVVVSVLPKF
jgi:repressor LexA